MIGVIGLIGSGFSLFILTTSNPFERLLPAVADGRSLNPLLQDPGLIFHPPMLYMGYVGFSVAFAFAISALLSGRLDAAWARWTFEVLRHGVEHHSGAGFIAWPDTGRAWVDYLPAGQVGFLNQLLPPS